MVWRLLFIGLLGAALAMPMAVVAQSADPFQWDRREFAGQSVRTRPRPELDPLGIRVGSFRFYPSLEIGGRYEDNVFRSPSNEKGDLVTTVRHQNIWLNSRRRLAEVRPRLGGYVRRRACGVASADVRWSVA